MEKLLDYWNPTRPGCNFYQPDSSTLSYDDYGPKRKDDGELERQDTRIKISRCPCWLFLRFFYI